MNVSPSDLRAVPLFASLKDEHLSELINAFDKASLAKGHVLFQAGDVPERLLILASGEVTLTEEGSEVKFTLKPVAPIGELGALTGLPRNTTAIATTDVVVWSVTTDKLMTFFERRGDIAFPFYRSLLDLVSEKVRRDKRRANEMRANLIHTQKAMKKLRDLILDSAETELSKPAFEALNDLIENNRRSHYRVTPVEAYPAHLRLDDGKKLTLLELSEGYLKLDPASKNAKDSEMVAVLVMPLGEILVSGKVIRVGSDGAVVKLDPLIDEYRMKMNDYITRLQLLDFVV